MKLRALARFQPIYALFLASGLLAGATYLRLDRARAGGDVDPVECGALLGEYRGYFNSYVKAADRARRFSKDYFDAADALAGFFRRTEGSECFEAISQTYAIDSYREILQFDPEAERKREGFAAAEYRTTRTTAILELLERLAREGKLLPLTTKIRRELGGAWNATETRGRQYAPRMMGAYDCSTSVVWFDPFLPPFNLGGVIAHELDHFTRDKLTYGLRWEESRKRATLEQRIVLDEVMANVMGAITQYRFLTDSNRDFAYEMKRLSGEKNRFRIPDDADLSLFRKDGALAHAWRRLFDKLEANWSKIDKKRMKEDRRHLRYTRWMYDQDRKSRPGTTMDDTSEQGGIGVFGSFRDVYRAIEDADADPELETIITLVARSYFPDKDLDPLWDLTGPIREWLAVEDPYATLSPLRDALSARFTLDDPAFRRWDEMLKGPSLGCREMMQAIDERKLPPGTFLENREGVRPELRDLKLNREGVRPSIFIQACAWPDQRF